jgi:hypothetical protein
LEQEDIRGEWNVRETFGRDLCGVGDPRKASIFGLDVSFGRFLTVPSTVQQFAKPRRLLVGQSTSQLLRSKPSQSLFGW